MYPRKENRSERVNKPQIYRKILRLPGRISGNKLKNPGKMTDFLKKKKLPKLGHEERG